MSNTLWDSIAKPRRWLPLVCGCWWIPYPSEARSAEILNPPPSLFVFLCFVFIRIFFSYFLLFFYSSLDCSLFLGGVFFFIDLTSRRDPRMLKQIGLLA